MTGRFDGKVAIVTGAAGGIGRAAAVRLAHEGARIVAVDLRDSDLAGTVAAAEAEGPEAIAVPADVTRWRDVEGYVEQAVARFGGVDLLFNNAGIEGAVMSMLDYPEETWDRVMAVNVKGVWFGIKAAAPAMRERGGGAIVNTASVAGLGGTPRISAYGASKHAVIGLTKSAAIELAPDRIRVNAVCPSPIETRMMRSLERGINPDEPETVHQMMAATIPLGRYGEAAEVAALVAFLFSEDAAYITGGIYTVDGGSRAR
ncbi:MAG: SDR family oxidoreductase [Dehalococcoidia bacterium]